MSLVSLIVNEVVAWCMLAREQTSKMLKDATVSLLNFRHLRTFCLSMSCPCVPNCAHTTRQILQKLLQLRHAMGTALTQNFKCQVSA